MLLKHPSSYRHQIAFTFPGAKRSLYQRARDALLIDVRLKSWTANCGTPLNDDTVFWEEDWGKRPAPEFYEAYRDSVLIVVFFDESYEKSRGAYPEWQFIQREMPQLHGRILPVQLDGHADWKIEGSHFNGVIDV